MSRISLFTRKLSTFQIIIFGFAGVILVGALLLMLPAASADGTRISFSDSLFTATSAVCVTGLVVRDTAVTWSYFGQAVILVLIQIGGLGVISVGILLAMASGRKIGLMQRSTLQDALSAPQLGGIVKMTGFILKVSLILEFGGAAVMMPAFCSRFGMKGIWMSVFHSVSAFCNAGFDVMGSETGAFSSLTSFADNPLVVTVICVLIVVGGIGFLTWDDVRTHGFRFRKYRMQSKVILTITVILIAIPFLLFFLRDFAGMPAAERVMKSVFQAITPRTAGFNTANLSAMSGAGRAVLVVLMLIGGAPGSTAGGMKTTTAAVLFANIAAAFNQKKNATYFGRRIEDDVVKKASTIMTMYLFFSVLGALIISAAEVLPFGECFFETASAIGTVGLSLGMTPSLGLASRLVLMCLMYFGRVGGLTLLFAAVSKKKKETLICPTEKITVG